MDAWTPKAKASPYGELLCEDGTFLLQEDGFKIVLEQNTSEFTNLIKH